MLQSDWLVLTVLHVHITSANYIIYFKRSSQPTTAKEPKPTTTLTKQVNIDNNRIKTMNYFHVSVLRQLFKTLLYYTDNLPLPECLELIAAP